MHAGDRAPDAPALRDRSGGMHRVFDVFRGPQATLLAFGDAWTSLLETAIAATGDAVRAIRVVDAATPAPDNGAIPVFVDSQGHASTAWEPGGQALFAIRPDGVVGFAADQVDEPPLMDWLRRVGLRL